MRVCVAVFNRWRGVRPAQPYITTFLNKILLFFDSFFPLFGTISVRSSCEQIAMTSSWLFDIPVPLAFDVPWHWQVGVFGMYLLLCTAKGNFKFGARFLLISVRTIRMK